jgi:hypothetical protein
VVGSNHPSPKTPDLQSGPLSLRYNAQYEHMDGFEPPYVGFAGRTLNHSGTRASILAESRGADPHSLPNQSLSGGCLLLQVDSLCCGGSRTPTHTSFKTTVFKTAAIAFCHTSLFGTSGPSRTSICGFGGRGPEPLDDRCK